MRRHKIPEELREYYSLNNFSIDRMEIIPEKEKMITVLMVEPMKYPKVVQIENELKSLQAAVGGLIQPIYPFDAVSYTHLDVYKRQYQNRHLCRHRDLRWKSWAGVLTMRYWQESMKYALKTAMHR